LPSFEGFSAASWGFAGGRGGVRFCFFFFFSFLPPPFLFQSLEESFTQLRLTGLAVFALFLGRKPFFFFSFLFFPVPTHFALDAMAISEDTTGFQIS